MEMDTFTLLILFLGIMDFTDPTLADHTTDSTFANHTTDSTLANHTTDSTFANRTTDSTLENNSTDSTLADHATDSTLANHTTDSTLANHTTDSTFANRTTESTLINHTTDSTFANHTTDSTFANHTTGTAAANHTTGPTVANHTTVFTGTTQTENSQAPTQAPKSPELPKTATTRVPDYKPINLGSMKVEIPFSISVNVTFSTELENRSSETYKNYSMEFQRKLLDAFNNTPGLQTIEITGFRSGSVITYYKVVLYGAEKHALIHSLTFINSTVKGKLNATTISISSQTVTINVMDMSVELDNVITRAHNWNFCDILVTPCDFGYMCIMKSDETICRDNCSSNPPQCYNGGECYVDYKYKNLKCRCKDTDEYVYSGDTCETGIRKVQTFSLSTKDYVIIAGSTAGAVVFILLVVSLIKCLRKKYRKGKEDNDLNDGISDINAAADSIKMNAPSKSRYTTENNAYMLASGMPELKKDHRVYKDPQTGEEALIYQPRNITKLMPKGSRDFEYMQSEQTSRRSFYDSIDTENPYKIKRPNPNESRNWPL